MAFTAKHKPVDYRKSPPPAMAGSEKDHLNRELKSLERTLKSLVESVREIQAHLESQP